MGWFKSTHPLPAPLRTVSVTIPNARTLTAVVTFDGSSPSFPGGFKFQAVTGTNNDCVLSLPGDTPKANLHINVGSTVYGVVVDVSPSLTVYCVGKWPTPIPPSWVELPPLNLRPSPIPHAPLPPWDQNDPQYGEVHTVQPPELIIPAGVDNLFMRADFNGVTLDANRWGGHPPMLKGANSTPVDMLMTPMLSLYPRVWQDACLTEHAERGYSHFIISTWNDAVNGVTITPAMLADWARYVQSWGFKVVYWNGPLTLNDPKLQALVDANAIDWCIPGEETDTHATAEQLEAVLDNVLAITANGIPIGAHFTANYPEGFPRDTMLTNWSKYDGKVHLCWQADQTQSAGHQAAMLYYARLRVSLGQIGGDGTPAPNSRIVAFETMASAQLQGACTEEYGNLRTLELLYETRTDARVRPMDGGFGNGCRQKNGMFL